MSNCKFCKADNGCVSDDWMLEKRIDFGVLGNCLLGMSISKHHGAGYLTISLEEKEVDVGINYCPMCGRKLGDQE